MDLLDAIQTPADAFLDLIRDKEAINAILADIGGDFTARAHAKDTAKVQKQQIADNLAGKNGRKRVTDWKPRYMRFPMQSYTKRGDLPAAAQWNDVKKFFAKKNAA